MRNQNTLDAVSDPVRSFERDRLMWKIDWNLSAKIRSLRKKYLLRMLGIYTAFFVGVLTVFLALNFNLFYKSKR